tara:strand:+ start:597 stop:743 length:147 start_codon:yes stop_codon:yes gene_type:complete
MRWIKKVLGITELIAKQDKTNDLLNKIAMQTKRSADLQEKYNESYHIK